LSRWRCALASLWLASACTNFPSIESGVCGNGIVDAPREDCDDLDAKSSCRPKGSEGECHFDCSQADGHGASCPSGWGCDSSAICRAPSATFALPSSWLDVDAWSLTAGDFDGDGRGDIMTSEPLDSIGGTRLAFLYFDEQGELEDQRPFPKFLLSPTVKDLTGEGRSDVAFAAGAIGLMLGRKDRTWVPETFSSYRLANAAVRVVNVYTEHIQSQAPIVPVLDLPGGSGFFVANASGQLEERAPLGGRIADLSGDPVSGNLFEGVSSSPCLEPVFALRGKTHFTVVDTCTAPEGVVEWRSAFESHDVALEPAAKIDSAPQVVDMNGDGHLDVLVGAGGKPYVAYGDGLTLSVAVPYRLPIIATPALSDEISTPLAAGDFSGDGLPDFVFADHLLVSSKRASDGLTVYSPGLRNRLGSTWTAAKIGDFNANGRQDVVAASQGGLNLEFYNGTGTANLTDSIITTTSPVQFLGTGDFDGDLIDDLVMVETPPPGETKSPVQVAFGSSFGVPGAPLTVAQVLQPETLATYHDAGIGSIVIGSHEVIAGVPSAALTILAGNADRVPYAPFALTELASNGSVEDSAAFSIAVGSFSGVAEADLLALAFPASSQYPVGGPPSQPWLFPAIEAPGSAPSRLAANLDARLSPTRFFDDGLDFEASAASAAADLDGDKRDEAIFAMPAGSQGEQCGVVIFGAAGAASHGVRARDPILIGEPCADPQIAAVDADADGFVDLALLTGESTATTRKLLVLWNDGTGGFSSSQVTQISGPDDSPQAFTPLAGTPGSPNASARPFGFAYVTNDRVAFVAWSGAHEFAAPLSLLESLSGGSGIAASDVNGDGVIDLVVALSGKLGVLKAQLVAR
jgi:hypothetical protein